ncbi:hypothetical protein R1flu_016356 [Riccia fluitans]|uniref:Uncharacterized protein n=1 Tax=Riccia fluitans TaxID=41844 RepID=A0ABD1YLU1_9MARC
MSSLGTATMSCPFDFLSSVRAAPSHFAGVSRFSLGKRAGARCLKVQRRSLPHKRVGSLVDVTICRAQDEGFSPAGGEDRWKVSAYYGEDIPTQAESVTGGTIQVADFKSLPELDYLQELLAIQQSGPKAIGFFGTRNMGFMHQQLIEILSYAMVITKNHIYTSGASGTNAAVIRGALRAEMPELLTVLLPQSLKKQPPESQELLSKDLVQTCLSALEPS